VFSPLVIGGTGGSGTRVVARIVRLGGRYMGSELNRSEDTMPFARFDWEWGRRYLESGSSSMMVRAFEDTIAEHLSGRPEGMPWGWKHPHSYLLLPFLHERFSNMRFIHVIRDGRDIALSGNQQQAEHYGPMLRRPHESEPVRSAAWWAWANDRARASGENLLGSDYLVVRFEDLCADPVHWTQKLAQFSEGRSDGLAREVSSPASLGRWRQHDRIVVRDIEAACHPVLTSFDYPTSTDPRHCCG